MKRGIVIALISFMFVGLCGAAHAMTDEEAYGIVDSLANAVTARQQPFDSAVYFESLKNQSIRRKPSYMCLMIRSDMGRPIPILHVRDVADNLIDATALNITFIPYRPKLKRPTDRDARREDVSFTLESEGVQRWTPFIHSSPHYISVALNATINEEMDKIGKLAGFCGREGFIRITLSTPLGEVRLDDLSWEERSAISETWRYFEAYAHLAKTYFGPSSSQAQSKPAATPQDARARDEYYRSRLEEVLKEFEITGPEQNRNNERRPGAADDSSRRTSDARLPAITEVPVRVVTVYEPAEPPVVDKGLTDAAEQQRRVLLEQRRILNEQRRMLAEIRRLIDESRREAEWWGTRDPEIQRLTDQLIGEYIEKYWQM